MGEKRDVGERKVREWERERTERKKDNVKKDKRDYKEREREIEERISGHTRDILALKGHNRTP